MTNFVKTYSSFAHGAVSPEFYTNDNIHGLSRLENMDVTDGGGIIRRSGLAHVCNIYDAARLVPFCVGVNENYILAIMPEHIAIYTPDGTRVCDILSPWGTDDIPCIQYAQRFDTMIFVHPDYRPRVLRGNGGTFTLTGFEFAHSDNNQDMFMPFMRFDDTSDVTITISTHEYGNNFATFTANRACWTPDIVGSTFIVMNQQWTIREYINQSQLVAFVNGAYSIPAGPVADWRESVFSNARGWPTSITFHQDRLIFGGSRSHKCGVWMSQVGRHNNFDVGTGLDDEAIFVTLLSQSPQHICTVVASDNLQILTDSGEWAITSKPLTPSSIDIKQHTSVGSLTDKYLAPQCVSGATVFISRTGCDIRQLVLDDLAQNYRATDLCSMAKHLMHDPIDITYNDTLRRMYVVMAAGDMAVMNYNAQMGIAAWSHYTTHGDFQSVCTIGHNTFVCVCRDGVYTIERFDETAMNDMNAYSFSYCASAMPLRGGGHNARHVRIRRLSVRVRDTKSLILNGMRVTLPNSIYSDNATGFSGDASIGMLGTRYDAFTPIWEISGTDAMPINVLSVTAYGHYII
ncbi:MAG: hypothetical protein IJ560_01675 [Alphaproteobacteria bacterium]|nr:hypothetical protein [Alphaproteobacteria bacterium]